MWLAAISPSFVSNFSSAYKTFPAAIHFDKRAGKGKFKEKKTSS
jgi:hypothetical protein